MAKPLQNRKIIYDPLWGITDITDFLPMVDVPEFQALGFKYQLGVTSLLFPAATHTRKQHSFGALKRTQNLAHLWLHRGFISEYEAHVLAAYALWHDIGHGPFSHVVEPVTEEMWQRDHNQNGAQIIERLKDAVKAVNISFTDFKKMFAHENPISKGVSDKNLGTEKLDYLSRDAYYTTGERPGVDYLALHTYFIDGEIMIDEKAIDQAKNLQEFYVKMYKTVYLRKNAAITQRMIQRMAAELLEHEPMSEEEFWALTDFGLLGRLENTSHKPLREYYRRFIHRNIPKTAVALRPEQFVDIERAYHKPQLTLPVPEDAMQAFAASAHFRKPSLLKDVEDKIARIAKLPEQSVLIAPPTSVSRFVPKDIAIYTLKGDTAHLSDYFPGHFSALEEEGKSYLVLRVCTFAKHREKLAAAQTAEKIREYLLSLLD